MVDSSTPISSSSSSSSTRYAGTTHRCRTRRLIRSRMCMECLAFTISRSFSARTLAAPSSETSSTKGSSSWKPRRSASHSSEPWPSSFDKFANGTRNTFTCSRSTPWGTRAARHRRNSSTVTPAVQTTGQSPWSMCAVSKRCPLPCVFWSVPACEKQPPITSEGRSATSKSPASSKSTSRTGMELEVLSPCWKWRQMPNWSWKR
mmetsp:Transcript_74567/g.230463  ORF Transcript_74567/g.230463 Transcript_74567/m.230463 type:complete len:204 (-) Transcript_74567:374-985(-)